MRSAIVFWTKSSGLHEIPVRRRCFRNASSQAFPLSVSMNYPVLIIVLCDGQCYVEPVSAVRETERISAFDCVFVSVFEVGVWH